MSINLGKSKSKSSSQQKETSTQLLDPRLAGELYSNIDRARAAAGALQPYTGQRVAGFNASQQAAQEGLLKMAGSKVGAGLLGSAVGSANQAASYKPMSISAAPVTGYGPITASTAQARPEVTTSAIGADQIAAYMNPFEKDVVGATMTDIDRQRRIEQTYNAAQATKARAFGGTGAAILSAQTNDSYARSAASTSANLHSQGYTSALNAAQTDAARRLQADQGNQQAGNQVSMFNAGQTQGVDQFNAGQAQALGQFNAGQNLEAQAANQQAGLSAAQLGLQSADVLSRLSDQERAQAIGDLGMIAQVGDAQHAQVQEELNAAITAWQEGQALTLKQQELLNTAVSMLPNYGTTTSSGTASSKGSTAGVSAGVTFPFPK